MRTAPISDRKLSEMAALFRILGDPTRLEILLCCLEEAKSVGRIADALSLQQTSVSRHLRLLRGAGLVVREQCGKHLLYGVWDDHVRSILVNVVAHLDEKADVCFREGESSA